MSSEESRVDIEIIWGVPLENLLIDSDWIYVFEKLNGFEWLNHPFIGDLRPICFSFLAYIKAGEPGPPFKYL